MIDALFGSKTRVKLLHLFLNNPGQSFFVREITRKIDEQINSVRRELSNMLKVGIITCDSADNKLYYQVDQKYDYYIPLQAIFGDSLIEISMTNAEKSVDSVTEKYGSILGGIPGLRIAVFTGVFVKGSISSVDALLVGNVSHPKINSAMSKIEKSEGRDINYSVLPYDEFYYRLSVRDKFITDIINGKHVVVVDKDNVIKKNIGE